MKNIKKIAILSFLVFNLITVFIAYSNSIKAILEEKNILGQFGASCEEKLATCPTGYKNIFESLDDGRLRTSGIDEDSVETSFRSSYNSPNRLCIAEEFTDITIRLGYTDSYYRLSEIGNDTIPVACPPGWQVTRGINSADSLFNIAGIKAYGGDYPYACCPAGMIFVNQDIGVGSQAVPWGTSGKNIQTGICADPTFASGLKNFDPSHQDLDYSVKDNGLYVDDYIGLVELADGNYIAIVDVISDNQVGYTAANFQNSPERPKKLIIEKLKDELAQFDLGSQMKIYGFEAPFVGSGFRDSDLLKIIIDIYDIPNYNQANGLNREIDIENYFFDALSNEKFIAVLRFRQGINGGPVYTRSQGTNPQLGLGLGPDNSIGTQIYSSDPADGRRILTQPQSALDNNFVDFGCSNLDSTEGCVVLGSDSNLNVIKSTEITSEIELSQCLRCFRSGEPMIIDKDAKTLNICDTSAAGNVRTQELINGNLQDTLAWLAADETNRPLLQNCRERGGIYTAIGCVDPTPVGIITGLIRITLGVIGGVALIQIILAGIAFQSGQEAQIEAAKKRLFATFGGLILLIFSVLILRIIGINVLDILPEGIF